MHLPNTSQLANVAPSPNQEASDGDSSSPEFLSKLFNLLEKGNVEPWVRWHPDGGLFIPDVGGFVHHVLHVYFPNMKKNKNQAHYVHWENKFCRGHRDLLPQVKAPPKESTSTYPGTAPLAPDTHAVPQPQVETPPKESTSTYLGTIQEQPHAPNTTAAPQPLDWINPDAATSDLEEQLGMAQNKVAELDQQLLEKRLLEKRFMALDLGRLLEIKELEGKLEVAKLELEVAELIKVSESRARKVSVLERQLKDKDNLAKDLLAQRDVAFSIINGSTSFRPVPTSLWPNTPFPVRSFQEFEYNQTY